VCTSQAVSELLLLEILSLLLLAREFTAQAPWLGASTAHGVVKTKRKQQKLTAEPEAWQK